MEGAPKFNPEAMQPPPESETEGEVLEVSDEDIVGEVEVEPETLQEATPETVEEFEFFAEMDSLQRDAAELTGQLAELSSKFLTLEPGGRGANEMMKDLQSLNDKIAANRQKMSVLQKRWVQTKRAPDAWKDVSVEELEQRVEDAFQDPNIFEDLTEQEVDEALKFVGEKKEVPIPPLPEKKVIKEAPPPAPETTPTKEEISKTIEKNEISAERLELARAEAKDLDDQKEASLGAADAISQTIKEVYGVDMNKLALSRLEQAKASLKSLFSPTFRNMMREYHKHIEDATFYANESGTLRWSLENPKGYAAFQQKRAEKLARASARVRKQPKVPKGPLSTTF
ncbi:hypothetical protein AMJ57_02725 [Parcubacteria bacterium SG8_24]|nr:MAG: hypothetical protein AMJ57_02725 [Parcubacteria bacterium SG8_24]